MNQKTDFYYVCKFPSFVISPEGKLLGPSKMDCGCQMIEIMQKIEKYRYVKVIACPKHEEAMKNVTPSVSAKIGKDFQIIDDQVVHIKDFGEIEQSQSN